MRAHFSPTLSSDWPWHRDDLALPEERRRRMFFAEAQAVVVLEGRGAANARASVEVREIMF